MLGFNDTFVPVTPEQMRSLQQRMDELLDEFRTAGEGDDRVQGVGHSTPGPATTPRPGSLKRSRHEGLDRPVTAAAARRTLLVLSFTRWLPTGLIIGLTTLLVLHRGMNLSEVG